MLNLILGPACFDYLREVGREFIDQDYRCICGRLLKISAVWMEDHDGC